MANLSIDLSTFSGEADIRLPLPEGSTSLGADVRLTQGAQVLVHMSGGRDHIDVDVSAELRLVAPCDRCLDEVALRLPVHYSEVWELGGAPVEAETIEDGPVLRRHVTEHRVDLADGFWQNASLEFPTKVLCREDCQGICPTCGANRNQQPCACSRPDQDPRLAALAKWRPSEERPDTQSR